MLIGAALAASAVSYVGIRSADSAVPELEAVAPVVDASLKDPEAGLPSGGWATIRGKNLAPLSRTWQEYDFQANRAPFVLEGVSVEVGDKPAFIAALRRGLDSGKQTDEIDIVLPRLAEGLWQLIVRTPGGDTAAVTVKVVGVQPSLFTHTNGDGHSARAKTLNGTENIGPFDLFGSLAIERPVRPAIPGEALRLTANGCGEFEEPIEEGMKPGRRIALAEAVKVSIGEQVAEVLFAGSAIDAPGVCVVEVKIPALPAGEYPVTGSIGEKELAGVRTLLLREVEYPGFQHGTLSSFKLTGAHHFVSCTNCHVRSRFWGTPQACEACHLDRYRTTQSPDHEASGFPTDCSQCHVTSRFKGARGGHTASSRFPLTGRHAEAGCAACHVNGEFKKLDTACASCHLADYEATTNPNHSSTGIGKECGVCHTPSGWSGAKTDHSQTQFPLTGKHAKIACNFCHTAGLTGKPPKECKACHEANYLATSNPNHAAAGYPTGCDACHTTEAFKPAKVDHPRQRFPLDGKHGLVQCAQCHKGGTLIAVDPKCASCHLEQYRSTVNPNHVALGFPQTCETCHTTAGFKGAAIKHDKFALTGRHVQTACSACHRDGVYQGTSRTCAGCHIDRYNATTKPPHQQQGYPTECQLCHSTSQFTGALFQHANFFALEGKHAAVQCSQCHIGDTYKGTPRDCVGCHQATYSATTAPNHIAQGFPTSCQNCHTPTGWKPANFTHTTFTLVGKHLTTECAKCHVTGQYTGTNRECYGCHSANYNATTNPNHGQLAYPTTCQNCHTPAGWKPASFAHATFTLVGKHLTTECAKCHVSGTYTGTNRECYGCHSANFNAAVTPNHSALAYPTNCQMCHTPVGWRPSMFTHLSFPLAGKHLTTECSKCHPTGVYAGTNKQCYGCHAANYAAALVPNHSLLGYPTDCQMCHTPVGWRPSTFTHPASLMTGAHTAVACSKCHVGGVFAGTSTACVSCHLANYNAVLNPNHAALVYPTACLYCHMTSAWSPANFTHKFPIFQGKHRGKWSKCTDCHIQPSEFKVFSCFLCHTKTRMDDKHSGVSGYSYDSLRCYACHPTGQAD